MYYITEIDFEVCICAQQVLNVSILEYLTWHKKNNAY